MPKKPGTLDELCKVLDKYFTKHDKKSLYEWQTNVNLRISRLEDKTKGGEQEDDPPPLPPDLG